MWLSVPSDLFRKQVVWNMLNRVTWHVIDWVMGQYLQSCDCFHLSRWNQFPRIENNLEAQTMFTTEHLHAVFILKVIWQDDPDIVCIEFCMIHKNSDDSQGPLLSTQINYKTSIGIWTWISSYPYGNKRDVITYRDHHFAGGCFS